MIIEGVAWRADEELTAEVLEAAISRHNDSGACLPLTMDFDIGIPPIGLVQKVKLVGKDLVITAEIFQGEGAPADVAERVRPAYIQSASIGIDFTGFAVCASPMPLPE